jgi:hypothetical protein
MKRTPLKRKTPLKRTAMKRAKPKKQSLRALKKKAWELLSRAIRLEAREKDGLVTCVSCKRRMPWKQIQAGHWIDGRFNSILFDERGIHPQCSMCNVVHNGRKEEYFIFMEAKYGRGVMDELRRQRNENLTFTVEELQTMIAVYQCRVNLELEQRGP